METRKIAFAAFFAGCVTLALLSLLPANLKLLAVAAGLCTGYLGYEFRQVLNAIPVAAEQTWAGSTRVAMLFTKALKESVVWAFTKRHPTLHLAMVLAAPLAAFVVRRTVVSDTSTNWFTTLYIVVMLWWTIELIFTLFIGLALSFLASIGARRWEKALFAHQMRFESDGPGNRTIWRARLRSRGLRMQRYTYSNNLRWTLEGLALCLWIPLKCLYIGFFIKVPQFVGTAVKIIHCNQRLLCAVDGTLGGVIGWWLFGSKNMLLGQNIIVVLCGGLIGVAIAVPNWEFVSKRCYGVGRTV